MNVHKNARLTPRGRELFVFLIFATLAAAASAQDHPIVARMAEFTKACHQKDAEAVAGFYVPEAILLPPRATALLGRKPMADHFDKAFRGGAGGLEYKFQKIEQIGPATAVKIGQAQVRLGGQVITSRSLHVWKNDAGTWQLAYDVYHVLRIKN